jgi:hypothetical protein
MSEPTRYPLVWPFGRPRTTSRHTGKFTTRRVRGGRSYATAEPVTLAEALERLEAEINRLGVGRTSVLSSNIALGVSGKPLSNQTRGIDPGVCLYFTLDGKPHALPCDRFDRVEQNIAALAAHIEATRAIERYGVADVRDIYAGFQALPPPTERPWRDVLGVGSAERNIEVVRDAYKRGRSMTHPDRGGSPESFNEVERAWEQAQKELS